MRKSNTQSISSVLKSYVQENNLERKMNELDLIKSWETVMGKTVSRYHRKPLHPKQYFICRNNLRQLSGMNY